jgi:CSLREA domain-containing protein
VTDSRGLVRALRSALLVLLLICSASVLTVTRAEAATFNVTTTDDEADANPGDGNCVSTPSGVCTYRAAIVEANALAGADIINLPAGTFNTNLVTDPGTIAFEQMRITSDITLIGAAAETTFIGRLSTFGGDYSVGLYVMAGGKATVSDLTIKDAGAGTVFGIGCGGGVINHGTAIFNRVAIRNNSRLMIASSGGGICNLGTMMLDHSSVTNNASKWNGAIVNSGTMTIKSTTIAGNGSHDAFGGSESVIGNGGTMIVENSTIAGNSGQSGAGGIDNNGSLTISGSIIAGSGQPGSICTGTVPPTSLGNNTAYDASCNLVGPGDKPNVQPRLGSLGLNAGGKTFTMVPLADSPAIDAGNNAACLAPDQIGQTRIRDGDGNGSAVCDIGAFEVQNPYPAVSSLTVNGGAAKTNSPNVTLTIAATGAPTEMRFSNDGILFSSWEPFAPTFPWSLASGDGIKTVYAQVRDAGGGASELVTDTIVLDQTVVSGPLQINNDAPSTNSLNVTLTITGVNNPGTGVTEMSFSNDGTSWSAWQPFTATGAWTLAAGGDGDRTAFARVKDDVGNVSQPVSDAIRYDGTAPTASSLVINGGAVSTTSTSVNLAFQASDAGGSNVAEMAFSNDGGMTWSGWQPFATTAIWTLIAGDGPKTVQVRVRDGAGNVSASAADTITLHTALGAQFGLSINAGAQFTNAVDVTLALPAQPGTTEMQVGNDGGLIGVAWEPYATQKSWQITPYNGQILPRTVYARFKDAAGAVTTIYQDDIILDVNAPSLTVGLGGPPAGQGQPRSPTWTVQITADDDAAQASQIQMRLSNRADFAGAIWQPYTGSVVWDFTGGSTVYVQVRDGAGNLSPVRSQTLPGGGGPGGSGTPSCSPRPPVGVNVQKQNGILLVTVAATGADNGLRAVRFDSFGGAIVDVGSQQNRTAPFAVSIPAGQEPTALQFTVRRQPGAQSATVRLVVFDGCGEWSTVVGGGPNAW